MAEERDIIIFKDDFTCTMTVEEALLRTIAAKRVPGVIFYYAREHSGFTPSFGHVIGTTSVESQEALERFNRVLAKTKLPSSSQPRT